MKMEDEQTKRDALKDIRAVPNSMNERVPPGKEFIYKESAGQPRQIEVYFPPNHNPEVDRTPAVLMFHGGGWQGGSLRQFRFLCHYLASRGIVAATASYQLKAGKAACVTDGKSAIRWMKANADELGIDPSRLVVGGGSAGAHVSFVSTLTPGLDDPRDDLAQDLSVVGYILFNPAFRVEESSEVHGASLVRSGVAPMIVFYGTEDDGQWWEGWQAVRRQMQAHGNEEVELWMAPDQPHAFFNRMPWIQVTAEAVDRFLISIDLLQGEPTSPEREWSEALFRGPASDPQ